jgi:hypothetical protein
MSVQVSTDGGSSWKTLKQWDSRDANLLTWTTQSFDLSPYVGGLLEIRFSFDSRNAQNNNYEGWFLDDVEVTAA